mgnify:CR=1 FL=1
MLRNLHVKNLALIDEMEVEFEEGLNILTGETGAGKSLIIGSINMALGQKVPKEMIKEGADYALVELIFEVKSEDTIRRLRKMVIFPEDGMVIMSRKITGGRSVAKINSESISAAKVKEAAQLLIDIHGQHEHQSLLYQDQQLIILDAYGKEEIREKKQEVRERFQIWSQKKKELTSYQLDEETRKREISFLEFELQEIEEAGLRPGEDEELEKQYKKMSSGRNILEAMAAVKGYTGNDNGAQDLVGRAVQETNRMLGVDESLQQIASLLQDVESLLSDVNREVSDYVESMTFSEEEFYETEQRLNLLNRMKAKYGSTVEEILACQEEKQKDLDRLYHFEQYKEKLEKEMQKAETELASVCEELSELRKVYGKQLEGRIIQGLQDLNFLDVKFEIDFETTEHYTANGNDKICFTISTNPGEPLRPLAKVVSGGELSRIMLAIKTILADKDETETLIFDEIDTGISGRTAQKVSEKMAVIGRNHQVICITHLPQIAAMADEHFEIAKKTDHQITRTQIRLLNEEDSALEIARILGGAQITEHTMESAKEMKELARKKKEEI